MKVMVLNDGTTFSALRGSFIAEVDDDADDVEVELKEGNYTEIYTFNGDECDKISTVLGDK